MQKPQLVDRLSSYSDLERKRAEAMLSEDRGYRTLQASELQQATFVPMEFLQVPRSRYRGEVGKKAGDYIFHFFPASEGEQFSPDFDDKMGTAFLKVFKLEDRLEQDYVPELTSFAVRARGFADNPLADELAMRVFDELDRLLECPSH